jgi:hypothetical protein
VPVSTLRTSQRPSPREHSPCQQWTAKRSLMPKIRSFRQTSTSLYQADPENQAAALELADEMHGWISAMIKMLELSSKGAAKL